MTLEVTLEELRGLLEGFGWSLRDLGISQEGLGAPLMVQMFHGGGHSHQLLLEDSNTLWRWGTPMEQLLGV